MLVDALGERLMLSALAVYALALLAFAVDTAVRGAARKTPASRSRVAAAHHGNSTLLVAPPAAHGPATGGGSKWGRQAVALTCLAAALHAAAVLARGVEAGRAPWGNMYEYATGVALAASVAFLYLLRQEAVRALGVWIVGAVLLGLGLSVTVLYTPADELVPALNSSWLVIHVAAAILAGGVFTLGAGASLLYLLRQRAESRDNARLLAALPSTEALDRVTYSTTLFAFPIWTFAVIAGAIWAEDAWGRYWGWDPKETWAFITWVLYAAYLHAGTTAGWRGTRSHVLALLGFTSFVFNFFGVNLWITGLHSYAGV